jgi:hypothetical protein
MFTDLAKPNGLTKDLGGENHPRHTLYNKLPPFDQCKRTVSHVPITRTVVR